MARSDLRATGRYNLGDEDAGWTPRQSATIATPGTRANALDAQQRDWRRFGASESSLVRCNMTIRSHQRVAESVLDPHRSGMVAFRIMTKAM
jgi:hypothetical protein